MEDADIAIYEIQVLARLFIIYQKILNLQTLNRHSFIECYRVLNFALKT